MKTLTVRVQGGRFVIDQTPDPALFPEGTVLYLPLDEDLDDQDREALDDAIEASFVSAEQGHTYSREEVYRLVKERLKKTP